MATQDVPVGTRATPSSRLLHGVRQSGARQIMDLASRIPDAIHLEIGEPDFTAAPHVVEAAEKAIRDGLTRYPPTAGVALLREAVTDKLRRINGIDVPADDVIISNGGCQALFNAFSVALDAGERVALPDPGWPNYRSMAAMLGLEVETYALRADRGYHPDPAEIAALLEQGVRCVVLCSPSNPLGTVTPSDIVAEIVALARAHGAWVISDECYDELYFGERPVSPASVDPDADVISVFSFSKTHAMTGWRIGYATGTPEAAALMAKAQEPLVLGVSAPGQYGALAAVTGGDAYQQHMLAQYRLRRDAVVTRFVENGHAVVPPEGAFYLWLDVSSAGVPDTEVAMTLLETEHVAATAGSSFGPAGTGYLRMSLAASADDLVEASDRIVRHLGRLGAGAR